MNNLKNSSCLILLFIISIGCAHTGAHAEDVAPQAETERALLSFFQIGKTTKKEFLQRWGKPAAQFENGKILSYRLIKPYSRNLSEWIAVSPAIDDYHKGFTQWGAEEYNLIIVFDADEVLQRYSLINLID